MSRLSMVSLRSSFPGNVLFSSRFGRAAASSAAFGTHQCFATALSSNRASFLFKSKASFLNLAKTLLDMPKGHPLLLGGDLGCGKTTFAGRVIQGILGDADMYVPSPTFVIDNIYNSAASAQTKSGIRADIHHWDLYRLESAKEADDLFLSSILKKNICFVEWYDRLPLSYYPKTAAILSVRYVDTPKDEFAKKLKLQNSFLSDDTSTTDAASANIVDIHETWEDDEMRIVTLETTGSHPYWMSVIERWKTQALDCVVEEEYEEDEEDEEDEIV